MPVGGRDIDDLGGPIDGRSGKQVKYYDPRVKIRYAFYFATKISAALPTARFGDVRRAVCGIDCGGGDA